MGTMMAIENIAERHDDSGVEIEAGERFQVFVQNSLLSLSTF